MDKKKSFFQHEGKEIKELIEEIDYLYSCNEESETRMSVMQDKLKEKEEKIKDLQEYVDSKKSLENISKEEEDFLEKIRNKKSMIIRIDRFSIILLLVSLISFSFPLLFKSLPYEEIQKLFILLSLSTFIIFFSTSSIIFVKKKEGNIGEILALLMVCIVFCFFISIKVLKY